jgi:hypothetical protein
VGRASLRRARVAGRDRAGRGRGAARPGVAPRQL